jgi:hypothetical protein
MHILQLSTKGMEFLGTMSHKVENPKIDYDSIIPKVKAFIDSENFTNEDYEELIKTCPDKNSFIELIVDRYRDSNTNNMPIFASIYYQCIVDKFSNNNNI